MYKISRSWVHSHLSSVSHENLYVYGSIHHPVVRVNYSSYSVDVPESDEGASMASEHSYTVPTDSTDGSGTISPTGWFQQACHVNMCTQCTI